MKIVQTSRGLIPRNCRGLWMILFVIGVHFPISGYSQKSRTTPGKAFPSNLPADLRKPVINIKTAGAKGDGKTDDTKAFQQLIDQLAANGGGTVYVPKGSYRINTTTSVKLKSHVDLYMQDSTAQLTAIPSDTTRFYVIMIVNTTDVKIRGGKIKGERNEHNGTTGEWGMGIAVYGSSNISIDGTIVTDCWGDGIVVGAQPKYNAPEKSSNIAIKNVVCRNNRRQGMSIGKVDGMLVDKSEFSYTGGTKPMAGIDIEPDSDTAKNITITNCLFAYNQGAGIAMYARSQRTPPVTVVTNIKISNNQLHHNTYGGYLTRAQNVVFTNNRIFDNKYNPMIKAVDVINCVLKPNINN